MSTKKLLFTHVCYHLPSPTHRLMHHCLLGYCPHCLFPSLQDKRPLALQWFTATVTLSLFEEPAYLTFDDYLIIATLAYPASWSLVQHLQSDPETPRRPIWYIPRYIRIRQALELTTAHSIDPFSRSVMAGETKRATGVIRVASSMNIPEARAAFCSPTLLAFFFQLTVAGRG